MTTEIDPRTGLVKAPSASGMERLALCPGSWSLEKDITEEETSEVAEIGNRIHAHLAGEMLDFELTAEEEELANKCAAQRDSLLANQDATDWPSKVETRLTINSGLQVLMSGQADFFAVSPDGSKGIIIDYKTGRGEVTTSESNLQLAALAVLLHEEVPTIEHMVVAIVQPHAGNPKACEYGLQDLEDARAIVMNVLNRACPEDGSQPPLVPGEKQCKYCKAKTTCPALQNALIEVVTDLGNEEDEPEPTKKEVEQRAAELPSLTIAELYGKAKLAQMLVDAVEAEMFSRLVTDPESVPGYRLEIDKPRISDAEALWKRQWLEANGHIDQKNNRAKRGTVKLAEKAWEEVRDVLIQTKTYEKQNWKSFEQAGAVLSESLTPEQYRRVAGKIVAAEEPAAGKEAA